MGARWSEKEMEAIRVFWKSDETVEAFADRLPGRTVNAINKMAEKMELGTRRRAGTVRAHVLEILQPGEPLTALEIAEMIGAAEQNVRHHLKLFVASGEAHIAALTGSYDTQVFRIGPGSGEAPVRLRGRPVVSETERRTEREKDEAYRDREASWWPRADPCVVNAFRAMVTL